LSRFWFFGVICPSFLVAQSLSEKHSVIPPSPKYEVRAVWIATVGGLDWPESTNKTEQQQSLREMVAQVKAANFNTIFFQVRGRGDAMYRSKYEPWARSLTGTWGKDPEWDPLQFILEEAHAVGLEVHAWFNTFLVKSGSSPLETSPPHVLTLHPDWAKRIPAPQTGTTDEWWLDPGLPQVRTYLTNLVMNIVRSYDVDGIHFDFIRYPGPNYPDEATYKRYGSGVPLDQWRRENINAFVRVVYDSIRVVKPWLKVGSAPIGIYKNVPNGGGLESYTSLYQDSRAWLKERKHDYLVPQVYWSLGNSPGDPDFESLVNDWAKETFERHVYIGIGAYKPPVFRKLPELIDVTRRAGLFGNSFFRYEHISQWLRVGERYQLHAIIPPMPWKDSVAPQPPQNLRVQDVDGRYVVQWSKSPRASDGDTAKRYVVYRSPTHPVDIGDPVNIVAITSQSETTFVDSIVRPISPKYYYAVTALDKLNSESEPTREAFVVVTELTKMIEAFSLKKSVGEIVDMGRARYFSYALNEWATVNLSLLDDKGVLIKMLVDEIRAPGKYVESFDVSDLPHGLYIVQYRLGGTVVTKPLRLSEADRFER
jgi:uncharacterized lipoprotein YddW (UPF0748 family)